MNCCLDEPQQLDLFPDTLTPSPKPLIGIYSSRAQSGKSTVCAMLQAAGWWNVKFADPLKDMVRGLLSSMQFTKETIERMVEGDLKEAVIPGFDTVTPRRLLQTMGTDWGREAIDKDLWVKVAEKKIDRLLELEGRVVVDDVRCPNEFEAIKKRGGIMVKVVRPDAPVVGHTRYEALLEGYEFDARIQNDGTLDELAVEVMNALRGAF